MKWFRKFTYSFLALFFIWIALHLDRNVFWGVEKSSCPFCNKEVLEGQTFYEGCEVLGILTYKPSVEGHVLIIPKRHVVYFDGLTKGEMGEIQETIQEIHQMFQKYYGMTGYLLLQKNGKEAGQSVPHVHFHYIPRKVGQKGFLTAFQIFVAPFLKPLDRKTMKTQAEEYSHHLEELHREKQEGREMGSPSLKL